MSTANSNQARKKGKEGKRKTVGTIILVVIILVLAGVIAFLLLRKPEEERRNVVVTPDNVEEMIAQMEDEEFVEPGYYTVTMSYDWHFAAGDAVSSDAYVENVTGNTNAVYFDLFLTSDEENAIYKSPVIPVGSSLRDIALDTELDVGTYDCVEVYHLVDDEQNTISTLRVTVTLIIEG